MQQRLGSTRMATWFKKTFRGGSEYAGERQIAIGYNELLSRTMYRSEAVHREVPPSVFLRAFVDRHAKEILDFRVADDGATLHYFAENALPSVPADVSSKPRDGSEPPPDPREVVGHALSVADT